MLFDPVQADHQYTLRELASVKAALHRSDSDLNDLQDRLQDQELAACEHIPMSDYCIFH